MSATLTIEVRDETHQVMRSVATRTGRALEAVAQEWVERMARQPATMQTHGNPDVDRRAFLRLTPAERRRLLADQAERLHAHDEGDPEWRELETGELVEE